jgi:hypothetical protein
MGAEPDPAKGSRRSPRLGAAARMMSSSRAMGFSHCPPSEMGFSVRGKRVV